MLGAKVPESYARSVCLNKSGLTSETAPADETDVLLASGLFVLRR